MTELYSLSNGLRVLLDHQEHFKTASLGLYVHVGSRNENTENNGISHVIEHMLFKGTSRRDMKEISKIIAEIGDDVNAYTSKEYTSYYGTTLTEYLPVFIDLLGDMLHHSEFDKELLEREKAIIMDEIDMYFDSPDDLVHEKVQYETWYPNPLAFYISGSRETVKNITSGQLREFIGTYYVPENMLLSVAGKLPASIKDDIEKAFGETNNNVSSRNILVPPTFQPVFTYQKKDIEQYHINIAYDSVSIQSEENYTATVVNSILGGSNNARLFQIIREEMGLAYSIDSYTCGYENTGLFQIDLTVNPNQSVVAVKKIFEIINTLIKDGITDEELRIHKNQLIAELIMGNESAKNKMNNQAKSLLLYGKLISVEDMADIIKKITKEEVREFAEKYLSTDRFSVCIIGPKSKHHMDQLKALLGKNI